MRKAAKVTGQQLNDVILKAIKKCSIRYNDEECSVYELIREFKLNKKVKVDFDTENTSFEADEDFNYKGLIGLIKIGDLVCWGCSSGGDWEFPVYFIFYLDNNNKLQMYIPKDGNVWNYTTKRAVGNDEEADDAFFNKLTGKTEECVDASDFDFMLDVDKIKKDISDRIQVVDPALPKVTGCRVIFEGLTPEQAETLARWYEGIGEQNAETWFDINNIKTPMTDCQRSGGFMEKKSNGDIVVYCK